MNTNNHSTQDLLLEDELNLSLGSNLTDISACSSRAIKTETDSVLSISPLRPTKLLYIHIGKAAGTSLNNLLLRHFPNGKGITHIESKPYWLDPNRTKDLLGFDFISGHISLPAFRKRVTEKGYFIISIFRNPVEHIASHLVWVKQMCSPGKEDFLAGHPEWVQEIARKLWNIDFSSNEEIADFFDSMTDMEAALFDNAQTRYLLNIPGKKRVSETDSQSAKKMLNKIDLVGTTEHYDEFATLLSFVMNWPVPRQSEKLNTASTKFGLDINSAGFERAVERVIWSDRIIYEAATKRMAPQVNKYVLGNQSEKKSFVTKRIVMDQVVAHLDTVRPDWVSGWAMNEGQPDVPIAVRLYSEKTQRTWIRLANQPRIDLKQKGLHPTGQCGFVFALEGDEILRHDDEIIVSVMWSDKIWRRQVAA